MVGHLDFILWEWEVGEGHSGVSICEEPITELGLTLIRPRILSVVVALRPMVMRYPPLLGQMM